MASLARVAAVALGALFALTVVPQRQLVNASAEVTDGWWIRVLPKTTATRIEWRFGATPMGSTGKATSKAHGVFRVETDFGKLVELALPLLRPSGVLFASTNSAKINPEKFLATIVAAIHSRHRKVLQQHYVPQPPDFPITRAEPAYLKTVWLRVA